MACPGGQGASHPPSGKREEAWLRPMVRHGGRVTFGEGGHGGPIMSDVCYGVRYGGRVL